METSRTDGRPSIGEALDSAGDSLLDPRRSSGARSNVAKAVLTVLGSSSDDDVTQASARMTSRAGTVMLAVGYGDARHVSDLFDVITD